MLGRCCPPEGVDSAFELTVVLIGIEFVVVGEAVADDDDEDDDDDVEQDEDVVNVCCSCGFCCICVGLGGGGGGCAVVVVATSNTSVLDEPIAFFVADSCELGDILSKALVALISLVFIVHTHFLRINLERLNCRVVLFCSQSKSFVRAEEKRKTKLGLTSRRLNEKR